MKESPFALICNDLAKKFDEAAELFNFEETKELLEEAKTILEKHDEPAYAPLFYSVGTSSIIVRDALIAEKQKTVDNPYVDQDVINLHSEAVWFFRHAEELLKEIPENVDTGRCSHDSIC